MPIRACPECSSDRLVFPKAGTTFTCDDCTWSGTPNEYPNWSAWQAARATRVTLKEKAPVPSPTSAAGTTKVAA